MRNKLRPKPVIAAGKLQEIARHLHQAQKPLLICGGVAVEHEQGLEVALVSALIQWALAMPATTIDFTHSENYHQVGSANDLARLNDLLNSKAVGVVFFANVDPLTYCPKADLAANLGKARLRVGMSAFLNETMHHCDIWLPLGPYYRINRRYRNPTRGTTNLVGPVLKVVDPKKRQEKKIEQLIGLIAEPLYDSRGQGDILVQLMHKAQPQASDLPASYSDYLFARWAGLVKTSGQWLYQAVPEQRLLSPRSRSHRQLPCKPKLLWTFLPGPISPRAVPKQQAQP